MKRLFFLAFFCFVNSLALKAQDLEWLIEPEDFLPPRDITVFFNDTSCTNDFTSDLWEGSYDGGTRVEMWGWEAMEGVHWACDCNGEVFYSHVPSLNVLENYSLSSDASGSSPELIIAAVIAEKVTILYAKLVKLQKYHMLKVDVRFATHMILMMAFAHVHHHAVGPIVLIKDQSNRWNYAIWEVYLITCPGSPLLQVMKKQRYRLMYLIALSKVYNQVFTLVVILQNV